MVRQGVPLGRVLGIPIGLDYSWFLIFGLITWSLAASYFPAQYPDWPGMLYWITGLVTSLLFFASVLLHELGHAVVARRFGVPVRSITLFVFGGVAQIGQEPPSAGAEFWIALAGPVVSGALAVVFDGLRNAAVPATPLQALGTYLVYINAMLALFNLIPGYPLDGGRIFRAIVWEATHSLRRATQIAAGLGRLIAYLFIVIGVWQIVTGHLFNGLWIVFIGWFLESAAASSGRQVAIHDLLAGHHVRELMIQDYPTLSPDLSLETLIHDHILATGRHSFPVVQDGRLMGLLTLDEIRTVPRAQWPATRVEAAMTPRSRVMTVGPDAELADAFDALSAGEAAVVPVVETDRLLGVLSRNRVIAFLRARALLDV
jgi:Zn-dependent protease/predicted transcriptional regulator